MVACICLIVYHIAHCLSTLKACDLASDWLLVVYFYVINLVACRVAGCTTCGGGNIFFFQVSQVAMQATGCLLPIPMQLYWLLAWSLVSNQGFLEKSVLEESMQLHQATWASASSLAIVFNGNQGGRLSHCCRSMCTCIFTPVFFAF